MIEYGRFPHLVRWLTRWLESPRLANRIVRREIDSSAECSIEWIKHNGHRRVLLLRDRRTGQRLIGHVCLRPAYIRHLIEIYAAARKVGLRAPEPVGFTCGRSAIMWHGACYLLLRFVAGEHPTERLPIERLPALGRSIGRLHSIHATVWGRPQIRSSRSNRLLLTSLHASFRQALGVITQVDGFEERVPTEELVTWLVEQGAFLRGISRYYLSHGDLHRRNILLQDDGGVFLLDFELASYGIPCFEFASVLYRHGRRSQKRYQILERAYRDAVQEEPWSWWCEHRAFATVGSQLLVAAKRARRAGVGSTAAPPDPVDVHRLQARALHGYRCAVDLYRTAGDGGGDLHEIATALGAPTMAPDPSPLCLFRAEITPHPRTRMSENVRPGLCPTDTAPSDGQERRVSGGCPSVQARGGGV